MVSPEMDGCLRRLRIRRVALQAAADSAHPHNCPDELVWTLHSLYDLHQAVGRATVGGKISDDEAARSRAGRVTHGLLFARGAATHNLLEYGAGAAMADVYVETYTALFTPWVWSPVDDRGFKLRRAWYHELVVGREVREPVDEAVAWLEARAQP